MTRKLTAADYPLAEIRPDLVEGARGKALAEVTLESVLSGDCGIEDLRITPQALRNQAEIASAAGRDKLAANFERAAEMTALPAAEIMEIYELLRPGRARDASLLRERAARLRRDHRAEATAGLLDEAAEVYERRGLFRFRY